MSMSNIGDVPLKETSTPSHLDMASPQIRKALFNGIEFSWTVHREPDAYGGFREVEPRCFTMEASPRIPDIFDPKSKRNHPFWEKMRMKDKDSTRKTRESIRAMKAKRDEQIARTAQHYRKTDFIEQHECDSDWKDISHFIGQLDREKRRSANKLAKAFAAKALACHAPRYRQAVKQYQKNVQAWKDQCAEDDRLEKEWEAEGLEFEDVLDKPERSWGADRQKEMQEEDNQVEEDEDWIVLGLEATNGCSKK